MDYGQFTKRTSRLSLHAIASMLARVPERDGERLSHSRTCGIHAGLAYSGSPGCNCTWLSDFNQNLNESNTVSKDIDEPLLTKGDYIISYSSVSSETMAIKILSEVKSKGYNNSGYYYIPDYDPSGKQLFKVYIGPFSSLESSQITLTKIKALSPGAYAYKL